MKKQRTCIKCQRHYWATNSGLCTYCNHRQPLRLIDYCLIVAGLLMVTSFIWFRP